MTTAVSFMLLWRQRRQRRPLAVLPIVLALLMAPSQATSQPAPWQRSVELGANMWYGAAHARVLSSEIDVGHADSSLSIRTGLRFGYADDHEADEPRRVTARSTELSLGIDYRPFDRWSPFVLGSAESILQQRIALRVDAGFGAKLTLLRKERDDLSISLAMLTERTRAQRSDAGVAPSTRRTRWSLRFRYRRQLTPVLYVSHVTFYQPAIERPALRYTVDASTSLDAAITSSLSLAATLRHRYDSEARSRGASSNNDGKLVFGLRAHF